MGPESLGRKLDPAKNVVFFFVLFFGTVMCLPMTSNSGLPMMAVI